MFIYTWSSEFFIAFIVSTDCFLLLIYFQTSLERVERFEFYERAKKAFAIVHTGYANIKQVF